MMLMVHTEKYHEDESKLLKESKDVKEKAVHPDTALKDAIRKRFERKIKAYTIAEGKFKTLSIDGKKFSSDQITF
jgi:hypothetical protein